MRPTIELASVLVRAVFIVGIPAVGSAQPPTPAQPPSGQSPPTVSFDLVAVPGTQPLAVTVPRAQFFFLALKGRVPGASYRVTYDWIIDPETPSQPPAGALHAEYEMRKMDYQPFPVSSFPPACGEVERRFGDLMRVRDEREAQEKLVALGDTSGGDCPPLKNRRGEGRSLVEPKLRNSHSLYTGDELRYVVERLDPATGAALKTWRFTVRPESVRLGSAYADEESWIVGETSRDIVEMVLYARDRSLPSAAQLAFSVSAEAAAGTSPRYVVAFTPGLGAPQRHALGFASYIWSPESYEPLAAGMINSLKLRPADPSPEGLVSDALTNPLSRVLVQESQRVSQRLQTAMLDAGAHERAALIVGALALREAAGPFTDVRQALCRMSAHLALARALRRGTASPNAAYADALLLTLVQRQKDALARIDTLERTRPAPEWAAFLRALRIRLTRDWRILPDPAKATLLERLQHYRALSRSLNDEHAQTFLASFKPEPIGDWGRTTTHTGPTPEAKEVFAASLASIEMGEAADVWRILHGAELPKGKITDALNAPPQRLVSAEAGARPAPHVIGWGVWARFFQRNLMAAADSSAAFQRTILGLTRDAQRAATVNETFAGLELWPAISLQAATPERRLAGRPATGEREELRRAECARSVAVVQNAPERVPVYFWMTADNQCYEARQAQSLPEARRWLRTLTPAGTALMPQQRGVVLLDRKLDGPQLYKAIHELAPFEPTALDALAPDPRVATFEQVMALYGPLAEYDLAVMKRLAWTRRMDVAAYRRLYEKITAIEPLEYLTLGHYLVDFELDDEAAAAYEKAIAQASDRISVSHSLQWLVGHYCDHARIDRAREVAQMAAEVYSSGGLRTMGYFSERMGKYADAESWYQKLVERYGEGSRSALENFYIRYARRVGDDRFSGQAAAALAKVFPAGLERVSPGDLSSPPSPGRSVQISDDSQGARGVGVLKDDLVVAVNGYRVQNGRQYGLVLTFDDRPEVTLIVWRQGRYVEVKGHLKRSAYGPISRPS